MTAVYLKDEEKYGADQLICKNNVVSELTFQSVNEEIGSNEVLYQQPYRQVKHQEPFHEHVLDTDHAQVHCGDPIETSVQQEEWSASTYQACVRNEEVDSEDAPYHTLCIHSENEEPTYLQAYETEFTDNLQVIHNDPIDRPVQQHDQSANRNQTHAINQTARRLDEAYHSISKNTGNEEQPYLQTIESTRAGYLQVIHDDPIDRHVVQPEITNATAVSSHLQVIHDDSNSAESGEYQEITDNSSYSQVMHSDPNNMESEEYQEIADSSYLQVMHSDQNDMANVNRESREYQDPVALGLDEMARSHRNDRFALAFLSTKAKVCIITTFTVAAALLVTLVVALALRPSLLTEMAETGNADDTLTAPNHSALLASLYEGLSTRPMSLSLTTRRVISTQHVRDFAVARMNGSSYMVGKVAKNMTVDVLSVSSDGRLLVGGRGVSPVLICNAEGDLIALVPLPFPHQLQDAAWTPLKSNIICILLNSGGQLVILSTTGTILKRVNMRLPQHLSVSSDNVIYVTEEDDGVSQSTDDGKTWSRIIDKPRIGWGYIFAIRLCIKNTTNTWVIEYRHDAQRLRIYSSTSSRDVTLPSNTSFSLHASKLLFDGDSDVYMSDYHNRAVHVWSVHGQYEYKLLFGNYAHSISCLAINKQRSYMYLGIENGFISTFTVQWASRT